ncbi:MAG: NAD(P)H-binding protein [Gemmatimonadales bacterium]
MFDQAPVLVIGASGRAGRAVVSELRRLGRPVRALARRSASPPFAPDVETVIGDLTDPDSLTPALAGIDAAFLVWATGPATVPAVVARLARSVRRVVLLSSPHQTLHPFFRQPNPMADLHASIERELAASQIESVVLRPGMFAANTLAWWAPQIRAGAAVRWPYGGVETAPIDERDIAAVAARALFDASLVGGDYVLTGPAPLSHTRQVDVIGEVLGRRLTFHELSPAEFRRETTGSWPPSVVEMLLNAWGATVGHPAYVTTTVADITGTPARSFHDWVVSQVDSFRTTTDSR